MIFAIVVLAALLTLPHTVKEASIRASKETFYRHAAFVIRILVRVAQGAVFVAGMQSKEPYKRACVNQKRPTIDTHMTQRLMLDLAMTRPS